MTDIQEGFITIDVVERQTEFNAKLSRRAVGGWEASGYLPCPVPGNWNNCEYFCGSGLMPFHAVSAARSEIRQILQFWETNRQYYIDEYNTRRTLQETQAALGLGEKGNGKQSAPKSRRRTDYVPGLRGTRRSARNEKIRNV